MSFTFGSGWLRHSTIGLNRDSVPPSLIKKGLRVAGQSSKAPHPTPSDFMLFTSPVPRPGRLGNKKMPLATRAFKDNTFLDVIVQEKASEWNASHRAEQVKCLRNGRNTTTLFSSHIAVVVCFLFLMYQSQRTIVIKPVY